MNYEKTLKNIMRKNFNLVKNLKKFEENFEVNLINSEEIFLKILKRFINIKAYFAVI